MSVVTPVARARSESEIPEISSSSSAQGSIRRLAVNELLFGMGEPKTQLYLVQTGALAVYEPRWNGHRAVIEFALPDDLVGSADLDDGLRLVDIVGLEGLAGRTLSIPNRASSSKRKTRPKRWPAPHHDTRI
jgi:CRP-like cAMP-binding protein